MPNTIFFGVKLFSWSWYHILPSSVWILGLSWIFSSPINLERNIADRKLQSLSDLNKKVCMYLFQTFTSACLSLFKCLFWALKSSERSQYYSHNWEVPALQVYLRWADAHNYLGQAQGRQWNSELSFDICSLASHCPIL